MPWLRAASTNKVARLAKCSAPALMVSTRRRSRSPRSEVASRLLMARMPVSGVRTSCAKAASAASTMPDALARRVAVFAFALLLALPRLRGAFAGVFLVAGLLARLRDCRFLGGSALRFGRDLAAMILIPGRNQHARPSRRSHGRVVAFVPEKLRQSYKVADFRRRHSGCSQFAQTGGLR